MVLSEIVDVELILAGLRPNSEIIGNVGISKFFLCNLVHYSKSRLHTNFEVRRRQRRREMIKNVFKMESGQSTLRNIFSQKIFIESCVAFKITYSHENLCKNIHQVALESELKILPKNL